MSVQDEDRFEACLKQFRPQMPEPLPRVKRRKLWIPLVAAVAAAAAIVMAGMVDLHTYRPRIATQSNSTSITMGARTEPLTVRTANEILRAQPSYKVAMDAIARPPQKSRIPDDKQSAFAVLSKERIRL